MKTDLELAQYFRDKSIVWETGGDDTQFAFITKGKKNILIFAPSNSKIDWLNNFRFFKKPYKHMDTTYLVHAGFLNCWKIIADDIIHRIKNFDNLTIVGWSYGGAMATLCTEQIWYSLPTLYDKLYVVTFGAPKVFSGYNIKNIAKRFTCMTMYKNGSDIVTLVPFDFMGYKHVTKLTKIGDKPKFFEYFKPYTYHLIDRYMDSLEDL